MLDRKRFGTNITEFSYLLTNPPAPVKGKLIYINSLLNKTLDHISLNK